MASKLQSHAPDIARLPISVNLRAISLAEGFRAALSVSVIIAAGQYLDFPPLREAALGALLTCLCDPGGPIRRRVPVLLSFTFIGALVTAGYGLVRELGPAYALPLGVFGLFCSSFVRIYGQAPQQLGVLLSTVQILALDRGDPSVIAGGHRRAVLHRRRPVGDLADPGDLADLPVPAGPQGAVGRVSARWRNWCATCTAWCAPRRPATPTGTRTRASTAAPRATRSRPRAR